MTMFNYESEELYQMSRGETKPSTPVYMADCKKEILTEVTPNYPKLTEYEKEWMYFAKNIYKDGIPVPLEYLEVQTDGQATVENVIPFAYKSAILKGNTDENLQSVKMPVLKTTGKNLFDISKLPTTSTTNSVIATVTGDTVKIESIRDTGACYWTSLNNMTLTLKKGINYWLSYDYTVSNSDQNITLVGVETDKALTRITSSSDENGRIMLQYRSNDRDVTVCLRFYVATGSNGKKGGITTFSNIQIEEGSSATKFEPYQSNILTVNEEVELRGVGNVKDELNLLTGELTERVGVVVLDGSQSCYKHSSQYFTTFTRWVIPNIITTHPQITDTTSHFSCDKLLTETYYGFKEKEFEFIAIENNGKSIHLMLSVDKAKTSEELKTYLSQNPITVQYALETESIKTVDLNRMIKPYEGTNHYTVSSNTIPPLLLLLVPIESTGNKTLNGINTEE